MTYFDLSRFGVSTNLFGNPADIAALVSQLGRHFPVIELEMEDEVRGLLQGDAAVYDRTVHTLNSIKRATGSRFSVHSPYVGPDCDLSADDAVVRRRSIELVKHAVRFAADLDASRVTYHPGHMRAVSKDHLMENLIHSLDVLAPWAGDLAITLCLENMGADRPGYIVFSPAEHVELCRRTGTRLTFDCVHHASLVSVGEQFFDDLELLLPYIGNIHFADALVPNHVHLPIGEGTMPLSKILSCLTEAGYEGNVIVEEIGGKYSSEFFIERARRYRDALTPSAVMV